MVRSNTSTVKIIYLTDFSVPLFSSFSAWSIHSIPMQYHTHTWLRRAYHIIQQTQMVISRGLVVTISGLVRVTRPWRKRHLRIGYHVSHRVQSAGAGGVGSRGVCVLYSAHFSPLIILPPLQWNMCGVCMWLVARARLTLSIRPSIRSSVDRILSNLVFHNASSKYFIFTLL